ncbi:MAG: hypothetical protein ACLP5V_08830 [Candidatus Bathyarchaeia archaeon]
MVQISLPAHYASNKHSYAKISMKTYTYDRRKAFMDSDEALPEA